MCLTYICFVVVLLLTHRDIHYQNERKIFVTLLIYIYIYLALFWYYCNGKFISLINTHTSYLFAVLSDVWETKGCFFYTTYLFFVKSAAYSFKVLQSNHVFCCSFTNFYTLHENTLALCLWFTSILSLICLYPMICKIAPPDWNSNEF